MLNFTAALICALSILATTPAVAHSAEGSVGGRRGSGLRGSNNGNVDHTGDGYRRKNTANRRRDLSGGYTNSNSYSRDNGAWTTAPVLIDETLNIQEDDTDDSSGDDFNS